MFVFEQALARLVPRPVHDRFPAEGPCDPPLEVDPQPVLGKAKPGLGPTPSQGGTRSPPLAAVGVGVPQGVEVHRHHSSAR